MRHCTFNSLFWCSGHTSLGNSAWHSPIHSGQSRTRALPSPLWGPDPSPLTPGGPAQPCCPGRGRCPKAKPPHLDQEEDGHIHPHSRPAWLVQVPSATGAGPESHLRPTSHPAALPVTDLSALAGSEHRGCLGEPRATPPAPNATPHDAHPGTSLCFSGFLVRSVPPHSQLEPLATAPDPVAEPAFPHCPLRTAP